MKRPTLSLLCLAPLLVSLDSRAADWPQYNGPEFNRISTEDFSPGNWASKAPRTVWEIDGTSGFSSFVTGGGMAYTIVKRGSDEVLIAVDAATGREKWDLKLGPAKYNGGGDAGAKDNRGGDGPRSTPVVHEGGIFAYDAHNNVYAANAATGKLIWKHSLVDEFGAKVIHWQNAASPIVLGDKVIVAGGGDGQAFLAFDRKSGKLVWKSGKGTITHATPSVATIHGKLQVLFFMRSGVVSVDPDNGEELWTYEFDFRTATAVSPVVCEDIVCVAAGYGIGGGACRVSKSGAKWSAEEVWREKKVSNIWSTPVCIDGYMYGMFSAKKYGTGPLSCVDIRTGEIKWEEKGFGQGHVSAAGGKVLALTDYGELAVVDPSPSGYKEVTRRKVVDGKCWSSPVYTNGHLLIRSTTKAVCLKP